MTDNSSRCRTGGNCGKLSILAYESFVVADDHAFELLDRRHLLTYWIRVLLGEHDGLPEEEWGNSHKWMGSSSS